MRWRPVPRTRRRSPQPRQLDADRVYRLLRALSTVGVVTESTGGRFTLTPLGRLLTSNSPHSMRTAAMLLTEYHADIWANLDGALEGGIAFETLNGQQLFRGSPPIRMRARASSA